MVTAARRGAKSIARGMNIMSCRVTGKFTPCERGYIGECVSTKSTRLSLPKKDFVHSLQTLHEE